MENRSPESCSLEHRREGTRLRVGGWVAAERHLALVVSLGRAWPAQAAFLTLGASLVTVVRKRYMDPAMPAIMSSSRLWRGFP